MARVLMNYYRTSVPVTLVILEITVMSILMTVWSTAVWTTLHALMVS